MLSENKFSKYLLYAIGEIVLVVIGILIALGINNLNEIRKDAEQEKVVLNMLLDNLYLAKGQSEELLSGEEYLKKKLIQILDLESNENQSKRRVVSDSVFNYAVWEISASQPTLNTYFNLKSTNQLGLIKNFRITELFTALEFSLVELEDILKDRLTVHQIRIDDIMEKDLNFLQIVKANIPEINAEREVKNDYSEILSIPRVRNLLGMKLSLTQDAIDRRLLLDGEIEELITLMEEELKE